MNSAEKTEPSADWKADDWDTARRRKFTLALAATPAQRLAWLEEAIRLAWSAGALPRRSALPSDRSTRR